MVFFWENDFRLSLKTLYEKPYALHWIPEVLSLILGGMLITSIGESCSETFPVTKTKIKQTFLVTFFTIGIFFLGLNLLVLTSLEPRAFVGFFWGSMPLLGYLMETRLISHAK